MRIYYVDEDPIVAADSLTLKTTSQAILYYSQLLCNAHHTHGQGNAELYAPNQLQHSYTKWVAYSEDNYLWLLRSLIRLLMNYAEHRHKEHKSRNVVQYLTTPPNGMEKNWTAVSTKALPFRYKEYPDSLNAHRAYYTDSLKTLIYQDVKVEFYYKIPSWTGFIEIERGEEEIRNYDKFSTFKGPRYTRSSCTIPIVASSIKNYKKRKEFVEVDIRTVAEELKDED